MIKALCYIVSLMEGIAICFVMFSVTKWSAQYAELSTFWTWFMYLGCGCLTGYPTRWLYNEYKKIL